MPLKVAVVVGHSSAGKGAVSVSGVQEYDWNTVFSVSLCDELRALGVEVVTYDRPTTGYTSAMMSLARKINAGNPSCAIELHFDGGLPEWHGASALHWPGSTASEALADRVAAAAAKASGVRNRGAIAQSKSNSELPLFFLKSTKCPAVILESHFGSNAEDHFLATIARDDGSLAREIARAVVEWSHDWRRADGRVETPA